MTWPETVKDAARLRLLYDLACRFAAHTELDELLPFVVAKCREVLEADGASVLFLDGEKQELYFPYVAEDDPRAASRLSELRFPADRGIAGEVLRHGKPLRIDDVRGDPRFYPGIDRETGVATRALLAAPLTSRQGRFGVVQVVRRDGKPFREPDLAFLEALTAGIAIAIENARLYAELKASEGRLRTQVGVLRRDLAQRDRFTEITGTGPAMMALFRLMESAAASPIPVLLEGETGTGKELVARGIHRASGRSDGAFLGVNCAALSETLLESELFGHRRGAFTGAAQDRRGLFEAAAGGTLFLDEIGEMPPPMQAKLLRVLQEGEVIPVGDTRPRKIDVRVISATNRDLAREIAEHRFREDLYYRLAAFPIRVPPLRERREDVPVLASALLAAAAERHRKWVRGIEPDALECLIGFDWPGNVRELQNELERAVALVPNGDTIKAIHLSAKLMPAEDGSASRPKTPSSLEDPILREAIAGPLRRARIAFETRYISEVLRQHGGNVSHAAKALGLSRVTLQKKMKAYGLR